MNEAIYLSSNRSKPPYVLSWRKNCIREAICGNIGDHGKRNGTLHDCEKEKAEPAIYVLDKLSSSLVRIRLNSSLLPS